jgi:glycosyltransferase involved in cell wall biosynthesis
VKVKLSEYLDIHRAFTLMQTVTTVIFYRVPDGTYFDACYNEARRLGVTVGYDIDDPIFSLDIYNANSNLKTLDKAEKNNLLAETPNYLSAMKKCDYLIASTPGIFAAMQNLINKPVYLWRNCIDFETNSIAETVLAEKNEQSNKGVVRIGYMSGSRSHDEDFSLVANILARVMGEYPEVELVVGGYADIPCELMSLNHRIEIVPYSGYQGYFKNISNLDIVIVPLVKDAFNECKSAIRFMEAAIMCKPCVSSEVGDFSNIVKNGETGFLADADESWYQALSDLISSPALRLRMGLAAASDVQSHYSSKVISETLLKPLLDYIKGRGRE